ncbi:hypothetical protein DPEC_G00177910 [Dallia pectoralis]|uniref:Uncharacterized protein n=1 Tax=Dallia pectoralis TaxID=75939 RepID=A0ACC2GFB3_DALPE|nr:hypothetical protein DPEC_G00177910 [Dallia pectoralis]
MPAVRLNTFHTSILLSAAQTALRPGPHLYFLVSLLLCENRSRLCPSMSSSLGPVAHKRFTVSISVAQMYHTHYGGQLNKQQWYICWTLVSTCLVGGQIQACNVRLVLPLDRWPRPLSAPLSPPHERNWAIQLLVGLKEGHLRLDGVLLALLEQALAQPQQTLLPMDTNKRGKLNAQELTDVYICAG